MLDYDCFLLLCMKLQQGRGHTLSSGVVMMEGSGLTCAASTQDNMRPEINGKGAMAAIRLQIVGTGDRMSD